MFSHFSMCASLFYVFRRKRYSHYSHYDCIVLVLLCQSYDLFCDLSIKKNMRLIKGSILKGRALREVLIEHITHIHNIR
jgi:hypothetical protein